MKEEVKVKITIETENLRPVDMWVLKHMIDDTVRDFVSSAGLDDDDDDEMGGE